MGIFFSATLPLIVYFVIEHFFAFQMAIILTTVYGVGEFLFFYIKDKRVDRLILISTLLVVIMGGVSFMFESDSLFKLKPAILQLMGVFFLGYFWVTKKSVFSLMKDRLPKNRQNQVTPEMEQYLNRVTRDMSIMLLLHTGLIVYAAYYLSTGAWTFISGILPYILMIGLMGIETYFYRKKGPNYSEIMGTSHRNKIRDRQN